MRREQAYTHRQKTDTPGGVSLHLRCRIQHILDEDAISGSRVIHKDMGYRTDELAVLDDGAAAHVCVK